MKMNFGFAVPQSRIINLDKTDAVNQVKTLDSNVPSAKRCIVCGNCSATCTAARLTQFAFHKTHLLFRRGLPENLINELDKCMLCGKCSLVCIRGVNTRGVIMEMKRLLNQRQLS